MSRIQYEKITTSSPVGQFYDPYEGSFQRDLETEVRFGFNPYNNYIRAQYFKYGMIVEVRYFRKIHGIGFTRNDINRLIPYL